MRVLNGLATLHAFVLLCLHVNERVLCKSLYLIAWKPLRDSKTVQKFCSTRKAKSLQLVGWLVANSLGLGGTRESCKSDQLTGTRDDRTRATISFAVLRCELLVLAGALLASGDAAPYGAP